ncbi:M23 family metallopeptidase [Gracilimonas sp.]|uniref:M23 family metallopeptidase n=1 Tax=Gracilimonas sp. TaxID=1974203 RepID=UPI002871617D|nr:M23 family metallopeptidase [Gracilimonas sp.]
MLFPLLFALIPIIQVGMPLYLIYRLWKSNFELKVNWTVSFVHFLLLLATLFFVFRWDVIGYGLRYWLNTFFLIAALSSFLQVKDLPTYNSKKMKLSWGKISEILLFVVILLWSLLGTGTKQKKLDLTYPLKGETNYVIHGGSTIALNYHGIADQQKYALDIVKLNDWGFRAEGLFPKQLHKYSIFGKTVYSPLSGTIVDAKDSLPDQIPPKTVSEQPTGNHIWIKKDSLYIVLAHLKQGSIKVEKGDKIEANQPIAEVGNTGNTTEPHLHIHGVKIPKNENPKPDSLLYKGKATPLTFNGKFLIRNTTF